MSHPELCCLNLSGRITDPQSSYASLLTPSLLQVVMLAMKPMGSNGLRLVMGMSLGMGLESSRRYLVTYSTPSMFKPATSKPSILSRSLESFTSRSASTTEQAPSTMVRRSSRTRTLKSMLEPVSNIFSRAEDHRMFSTEPLNTHPSLTIIENVVVVRWQARRIERRTISLHR